MKILDSILVTLLCLLLVIGCNTREIPKPIGKPLLTATFTLTDYDEQGKLVSSITRPSESYVLAFIDLLNFVMTITVGGGILDTGGSSRAINTVTNILYINGPSGDATSGIVVGTGTNAVAITDYALQTKIAHGTGAGQLVYTVQSTSFPVTSGSSREYYVIRALNNISGSTITINETGLYSEGRVGATPYKFCIIRDIVGGGHALLNGHSLVVTYTIMVTV